VVSPYDWNEAVQHRAEYVEERLKDGSPVVGLRYADGLLLLSLRRTQRKVFEIYDRLMMSAIGNQADIEAVRIASLDFAHQEGFSRSPDDVTVNRLVGFSVSPILKKAFGDTWSSPLVFRGVFAELGLDAEGDRFATVNYDGDFAYSAGFAVAAGTRGAEEKMLERLKGTALGMPLDEAVAAALEAWAIGHRAVSRTAGSDEDDDSGDAADSLTEYLASALEGLAVEAGVLERHRPPDARFRLLGPSELKRPPILGE
jgi:proteasome alpha subunit